MTDEANTLWSQVLSSLSGRIAPQMVDKLLRPIEALEAGSNVLLLRAPNDFSREWITRNYGAVIEDQLRILTGSEWSLRWASSTPSVAPAARAGARVAPHPPPRVAARTASITTGSSPHPPPGPAKGSLGAGLSSRYTFDQFIIGPSNQVAHAMASAMTDPSSRRVGILFLCGGTGLGKTHLTNAVGHRILEQNPAARVIYVAAETFMNEFVSSLQARKMDEFRQRFRFQCDALLMDDVQFFAGKDLTQEEFFHTFDALHQRLIPIVVTSDVPPQRLEGLAERLVSRFSSGLVAEIYPPELETRVAILRKKAEHENIRIEEDAAFAIASAVSSNVRELEGILMKLAIKASLSSCSVINLSLVNDTLRLPVRSSITTIEDVQRAVAEHYRIRPSQLTGKDRHREIALPRQLAMFLSRACLGSSFPMIGSKFGKDHTTVIAAVRKIKSQLEESLELQQALHAICRRLGIQPDSVNSPAASAEVR